MEEEATRSLLADQCSRIYCYLEMRVLGRLQARSIGVMADALLSFRSSSLNAYAHAPTLEPEARSKRCRCPSAVSTQCESVDGAPGIGTKARSVRVSMVGL